VADTGVVHEAVGPPMTPLEAGGAISVGVNSLLVLGVLPVLLGALAAEHRLTDAGIGLAAMTEVLSMGVVTGLAGAVLKPRRLKTIGVIASLVLALIDAASANTSGVAVFVARGAAGAVEGVLLWITVAMIARTATPERWAGVFFTAQTLGQLLLALAFAVWVLPLWSASGAFLALAACAVAGALPALIGPSRLADLNPDAEIAGAPPLRGWIALVGTGVFVSGAGAVSVYLQPLAAQVGLDAGVARTALWVSLAGQVAGGALATLVAGRIRWLTVFVVVTVINFAVWRLFALHIPGCLFVGANAASGLSSVFLAPFLVPMTIEADPSRRAAMQSGAAQLVGGAAGPLLAAFAVSDADVHGALWLGVGLTLVGLAPLAWLHFSHRRTH
jgi:hypothetical protein